VTNPGTGILPVIQGFTGITGDMVRAAPSFADIAAEVSRRTELHLFESWCHLTTVTDEAGWHEAARVHFDATVRSGVYKFLTRYFSQHRPQVVRL
jgi:hypothetical protein